MKVVFAPHVGATGSGLLGAVEFEIKGMGLAAVKKKANLDDDDDDGS